MNNIETIILQRLKLQSTRKALEQLGVNVMQMKNGAFCFQYHKDLSPEVKSKLILTLGGRVNYKETERYLETL